jgi:hypothetical protein
VATEPERVVEAEPPPPPHETRPAPAPPRKPVAEKPRPPEKKKPDPPKPEPKQAVAVAAAAPAEPPPPSPPPQVVRAPQKAEPAAKLGAKEAAPPVSTNADLPPLDDAAVTATFAKHEPAFESCLATARKEDAASLSGQTVTVTLTVNPNGKALYPTLDDVALNSTELGKCLKKESGRIEFPAFGGDPIRVRKPIVLK